MVVPHLWLDLCVLPVLKESDGFVALTNNEGYSHQSTPLSGGFVR